jgi:cyclopropane-fatty-acyl-phospholipid synthase
MRAGIALAERGLIPDAWIRTGIRRLDRRRLAELARGGVEAQSRRARRFLDQLRSSPVALETDRPKAQHYELPPAFFRLALGRRMKYSSGHWPAGVQALDDAEESMLSLCGLRAQLEDGMEILDLGCGWGSLTLWAAETFPNARVLAVSNARPQLAFIRASAEERGLANVRTALGDMNRVSLDRRFDRVLSIEMFEHMRNWKALLARIAGWLEPQGKVFVHVFTHRRFSYLFEADGADDWMGRHFFTAGMMPSDDLMLRVQDDLRVERHWSMSGTHYERTADAWLANMDRHREEILEIFAGVYGRSRAKRWFHRWRIFFMACAELWGYAGGEEWLVSHYRLAGR